MATRHLLFTVLKLTQFRFFFFSLSPLTIQLKYSLVLFLFLFYLNLMVFRSCLPFIMFSLSICLVCVFGLIKISHSLRSAFVSALVLLVLSPSQWMEKGTLHCSRSGFARIGLYTCTHYTRSAMKKESTTKGLLLFPYCLSAFCHLSPPTIMSLCLSVFLYLSLQYSAFDCLSACLWPLLWALFAFIAVDISFKFRQARNFHSHSPSPPLCPFAHQRKCWENLSILKQTFLSFSISKHLHDVNATNTPDRVI